jgi:hypothetical protein
LERDRIAATAQANQMIATATAQAAVNVQATAAAATAEATAQAERSLVLQAQQTQEATERTRAIVWGVVAVVAVVGACIAVYIWQMGQARVAAIRQGFPPARQLPSAAEWDVLQEAAHKRNQRIETRDHAVLLIDNETNAIVKRREL